MQYVSGYITSNFWRIILCITYAILMLVPISWGGQIKGEYWPNFILIAIFFWSLHAPSWMPAFAITILGLFYDALYALPIGGSAALYLIFRLIFVSQRQQLSKQAFMIQWLVFAFYSGLFFSAHWLLISASYQTWLNWQPSLNSYIITLITYPILHQLFFWLYKRVTPLIRQYNSQ